MVVHCYHHFPISGSFAAKILLLLEFFSNSNAAQELSPYPFQSCQRIEKFLASGPQPPLLIYFF